jgi:hypothetical protein
MNLQKQRRIVVGEIPNQERGSIHFLPLVDDDDDDDDDAADDNDLLLNPFLWDFIVVDSLLPASIASGLRSTSTCSLFDLKRMSGSSVVLEGVSPLNRLNN